MNTPATVHALTRIRPTLGRLVVRQLETDERTATGLILPFGREKISTLGEVIEVCEPYEAAVDDQDRSPAGPQFHPGEVVLFGKYSGTEVTIESTRQTYIIMNESDVLATMEAAAPDQPPTTLSVEASNAIRD